MSVFGAGYGQDSEIWGSTTVNLKKNAYVFQIFGGGEKGVVGKSAATGEYALTHEHKEHGITAPLTFQLLMQPWAFTFLLSLLTVSSSVERKLTPAKMVLFLHSLMESEWE